MGARATPRNIIDDLTEEEAEALLDFLNMQADPDTLSPEEEARVRAAHEAAMKGDYVTFEELNARFATPNSVEETV